MRYLRHQRVLDVIGTFDGLTHFKDNLPWFRLCLSIPPDAPGVMLTSAVPFRCSSAPAPAHCARRLFLLQPRPSLHHPE